MQYHPCAKQVKPGVVARHRVTLPTLPNSALRPSARRPGGGLAAAARAGPQAGDVLARFQAPAGAHERCAEVGGRRRPVWASHQQPRA